MRRPEGPTLLSNFHISHRPEKKWPEENLISDSTTFAALDIDRESNCLCLLKSKRRIQWWHPSLPENQPRLAEKGKKSDHRLSSVSSPRYSCACEEGEARQDHLPNASALLSLDKCGRWPRIQLEPKSEKHSEKRRRRK